MAVQFTPDGWLDIAVQNQRNAKYFALDRVFSTPLDFVEDGALIMKWHYYTFGIRAKLFLIIAKREIYVDATEYDFYYTNLYTGEVDFSQFSHNGPKVNANLMEGGIVKHVKANESVKYPIDIDSNPNKVRIKMDGVKLYQRATYLIGNGQLPNDLSRHLLEVDFLSIEAITSIGAISQRRTVARNSAGQVSNSSGSVWNTGEYFLTTGAAESEVNLEWNFYMLPQLAGGVGGIFGTKIILQLHIFDKTGFRLTEPPINLDEIGGGAPGLLYNTTHNFNGGYTITVPPESRMVLYMTATQNGEFTFYTYQNNGELQVNYTYTHRATFIYALRPMDVGNELIANISANTGILQSATLTNYSNYVITSGDGLRSIAGAKIKTSLADFFTSYNVIISIGMGAINSRTLKIEKKIDWVSYATPVNLGLCKDLSVRPATDYMFNQLVIGYPEQNYEDVNGRQEFNNTHRYVIRDAFPKEYTLLSVYRGDCYGAEFTRINLDGKVTTDDKADNDVFFLHIEKNPVTDEDGTYYRLERSINPTATGLLERDTVFNLGITPKRCLRENGPYIRSCFYAHDGYKLEFTVTEKNQLLETPGFDEDGDVVLGSLGAPMFTANLLEFKTIASEEPLMPNSLNAYETQYEGVTLRGICHRVSIQPANRKEQTYLLLSAPSNQLEKLIEVE